MCYGSILIIIIKAPTLSDPRPLITAPLQLQANDSANGWNVDRAADFEKFFAFGVSGFYGLGLAET